MFAAFMILLREGIEAFLVVAITLAYLRKTGRGALTAAVYAGVAVAVGASVTASGLFAAAANKPLWEGLLALVTVVLVASFTLHVLRAAKRLKSDLEGRLKAAAERPGTWAVLGIFGFTVLAITREGMEAAMLLSSAFVQTGMRDFFAGALLGLGSAVLLAVLWVRHGHRVNLPRLLQVTAVFLLLFLVQLLFYAFHELTEAGVLPIDNEYWHIVTEDYSPEGRYGRWLSLALVIVPLGWLAFSTLAAQRRPRTQAAGS